MTVPHQAGLVEAVVVEDPVDPVGVDDRRLQPRVDDGHELGDVQIAGHSDVITGAGLVEDVPAAGTLIVSLPRASSQPVSGATASLFAA